MKIGLCGNIALGPLAEQLDKRMPDAEIVVGKLNAFVSELSRPFGEFLRLDACVVALDWRDIVPAAYAFASGDDMEPALSDFRKQCGELGGAIRDFHAACKAPTLLFTPISDLRSPAGFIDRLLKPSHFDLFFECQRIFNDCCRSLSDAYPIDMEELAGSIGKDNVYDHRQRPRRRYPFTASMTAAIAGRINAMCAQFKKYPLKCMVLDLDDTLWGGIVGEDGFDGLRLGDFGAGRAYKDFQTVIVKMHKQGVILAVCSKNNTCDALDALERHPHCLIRPAMVSSFRINWDDKPKSMLAIASELNIGLDSMMFVDNSPMEREMMRSALPEVEILDLPDDPAWFAETLLRCTRFWPIQMTIDDRERGKLYARERIRKAAEAQSADVRKFLMNSHIHATVAEISARNRATLLPRITQLFNKTNQFNLTAKRYTHNELEAIAARKDNRLYYMSMYDDWGDYGIIGGALVMNDTIDSLAMSCRAFGKQAEKAFLSVILDGLRKSGLKRVAGVYIQSSRNGMTKTFYKDAGFTLSKEVANGSEWLCDLTGPIFTLPEWITLEPPIVEMPSLENTILASGKV